MPNFIPVQGLDAMVHDLSLTPLTAFTRTDLGVKEYQLQACFNHDCNLRRSTLDCTAQASSICR